MESVKRNRLEKAGNGRKKRRARRLTALLSLFLIPSALAYACVSIALSAQGGQEANSSHIANAPAPAPEDPETVVIFR